MYALSARREGDAETPWSRTLSATVTVTAASTTRDSSGASESTVMRPKTTEARQLAPTIEVPLASEDLW